MSVAVADKLKPLRQEVERLLIMSKRLDFAKKSEYLGLLFDLTEEELKEALIELRKIG